MSKLSVQQALLRADRHLRNGEFDSARALYDTVLTAFPKNARAQRAIALLNAAKSETLANQAPPQEQIDALIALYNQSRFQELVTQAEAIVAEYSSSFLVWNILAAGQKALGRLAEAENGFRKAAELNPTSADACYNIGVTLQKQGKLDEAVAAYRRALKIKPAYAEVYNNLGNTLKEQGKLDEAIAAYHRALEIKPADAAAGYNISVTLQKQGKLDEALAAYQRVLEINPVNAEVYNNMGVMLQEQGELEKAIAAYHRVLEISPASAEAHYNIGVTLLKQRRLDEAVAAYRRALKIKPAYAEVYNNLGTTLMEQGKLDEAIAAYQRALEIKPAYAAAEAQMLHQRQHICDFTVGKQLKEASPRLGIETEAVTTFAALPWEDNPSNHLLRAIRWSREKYTQSPRPLPARPKTRSERIKIGYFSADFHDHATMYLMAGVLRQHDRSAFETFAYSYGRSKSGEWRKRAENDVDHFFDVTDQSDRQIVDVVRSHVLDIAIDLKGFTAYTRSQLFQYRLGPIQINFLGYPGSMGAEFIDYVIADPVVIPAEQRQFYSEKVVYLPHSYQPNDNERPISTSNTTRSDVGLPDDAFVFCCFNNNYKISPTEFGIWMRLLHKVDGSVLWLLRSNQWAERNLQNEAAARGIDPSRLVFASKLPHSEHLARHKHADLFIDTFHYNAHTTASDALWAGLPVVTKQGKQFAARVAASLLTAVGLPELIAETEEEYEELITELAENPEKMATIHDKLKENRITHPLFDTVRYTRNFECGLNQVYHRYLDNKDPEDIIVIDD